MGKIEDILRRNLLRRLGHVHRMENNRFARQVMKWVPKGGQRKRRRPRNNLRATIEEDLNVMGMLWETGRCGEAVLSEVLKTQEGLRSKVRSLICSTF